MTANRPQPPVVQPFLVDVKEGAACLGVSERQFYELKKWPGFPAARMLGTRCPRWVRSELEQWAASLPPAEQRDEPQYLAAAKAAKASGQPTAHAPFPPPAATPSRRPLER